MPGLLPNVDPDGLLEYSVVYTDRALNHMSKSFQQVMNEVSATLKTVYQATAAVVVPGSGTFGMEAVARQFATGRKCLVIRNGFFSYRWSQILDMGGIPAATSVLKARQIQAGSQAPFAHHLPRRRSRRSLPLSAPSNPMWFSRRTLKPPPA
jgi:aspartate aminotransferase-like enzyme